MVVYALAFGLLKKLLNFLGAQNRQILVQSFKKICNLLDPFPEKLAREEIQIDLQALLSVDPRVPRGNFHVVTHIHIQTSVSTVAPLKCLSHIQLHIHRWAPLHLRHV